MNLFSPQNQEQGKNVPSLEVLVCAMRQGPKHGSRKIEEEKVNLSLFTNIISYVENPKESIKKTTRTNK